MSTPETNHLAPRPAGWYPDPAGSGGQRWHDGQGWTAQVTHSGPSVSGLDKSFARLADWLGRLLGLWALIYLLSAAVPTWFLMNPPELMLTAQPGTAGPPEQLDGVALSFLWIFLGIGVVYAVTAVTWLVWQYQLAVAAPVALRRSPAGHVGWWFVPFASYWIPRSNIGDLWHAYGTRRRGEPGDPTPGVFSLWWALWLAPLLMYPFFAIVVFKATTADALLRDVLAFWTLSLVAGGCSAMAARVVVRDLSWRALLYWAEAGGVR